MIIIWPPSKAINIFIQDFTLYYFSSIKKHPLSYDRGCFRINELAMTYSHMGNPTLPSAQRGFTSEFGKGSGGSLLLLSPAQLFMLTRYGLNCFRMPSFRQMSY